MIRRSWMPVRVTIQSFVVSTRCSRSKFVNTRSGTWLPTPRIPATWSAVGGLPLDEGRGAGRVGNLPGNSFNDSMLTRLSRRADGVRDGAGVGAPMADDAHAIDAQELGASDLLIIGPLLDRLQ